MCGGVKYLYKKSVTLKRITYSYMQRPKNVTHVQNRRRTWRILSTGFNSKETTYLLFVYEQAYLPYL